MMVNKYLLNEQTDKVLIIVAVYTYVKSFDVSIASQVRKEEREEKKKEKRKKKEELWNPSAQVGTQALLSSCGF